MKIEQEKKTRGRPRKFDLSLPPRAIRQVKQLSAESKIALKQVLDDVIENGLMATHAMYKALILERRKIQEAYESQFNDDMVSESSTGESEHESDREADGHLDPEFCITPESEASDEEGSEGDADELSGADGEDAEVSAHAI